MVRRTVEVGLARHAPIILPLGLIQLHPDPLARSELGGPDVLDEASLGASNPDPVANLEALARIPGRSGPAEERG